MMPMPCCRERLGDRLLQFLNGSLPAAPCILDIGMGTGTTTMSLLQRFPAARIHGCDLALNMIARARAQEALQPRKQLFHCCGHRVSSLPGALALTW